MLNTQPWRLHIHDGRLYVHGDHRRQLAALDPQRRALTMSIGCAVYRARAALAADGYAVAVRRFPDPLVADLVAVLEPTTDLEPAPAAAPGSDWLAHVQAALVADGITVRRLDEFEGGLVSELNRQADEIENLDPTYRAELDAWTSQDGRDRDRVAEAHECVAVLVTDGDTALDWLRIGEASMLAQQVAAAAGHDLRPSTQVIEVASARAQLRRVLGLTGYPHMLLRAGRSSSAGAGRRRLVDVLVEES